MYLGTNLSPYEYYKSHSHKYSNPHSSTIQNILTELAPDISGTVLDLGCGDGLVTKTLSPISNAIFIGIDSSAEMISRYSKETNFVAYHQDFWAELPTADIAIASYSLHLCEQSYLASFGCKLILANIKKLIIISPIKRPKTIPLFSLIKEMRYSSHPKNKTIYAYTFASNI